MVVAIALTSAQQPSAQQSPAQSPAGNAQQPQVKVNVLNVCAPSADQQKELSSALAKIPGKPAFGGDYEVARGRSSLDASTPIPGMGSLPLGEVPAADWEVAASAGPVAEVLEAQQPIAATM